jgi:sensor histidine kinase regulating citrate/malate metabolism
MKSKGFPLVVRFGAVAAILVVVVALAAQTYFARKEYTALETRLSEKIDFLRKFYAYLIADCLRRKDDIMLQQVINGLEEDQEITSVVVTDARQQVRYADDPQKIGTLSNDPLAKRVLAGGEGVMAPFQNSGGKALALVSPLKVAGNPAPIGAVRFELTYHRIDQQIKEARENFHMVVLGNLIFCISILLWCIQRWVLAPLHTAKNYLSSINPMTLEANLPESSNDFGQINAALNELALRFRSEWQTQQTQELSRAEQEKRWVAQLARSLLSDARVLVVDKNNRILLDSQDSAGRTAGAPHLLDLITDQQFANLVTAAFQKEGEVVRGPVQFQDTSYAASVYCVPGNQSVLVKTLIALRLI